MKYFHPKFVSFFLSHILQGTIGKCLDMQLVSVLYHKAFFHAVTSSYDDVYSFIFMDTDGAVSPMYRYQNWLGYDLKGNLRYEDCKLAYIAGQAYSGGFKSFRPHFECPVVENGTETLPSPNSTILEGVEAGSVFLGASFSDEELYLRHGPVTRLQFNSGPWIYSIQARYLT